MLECGRRFWGVPFRGSFIGECAGTATPLWVRLRSAHNPRFAQLSEHFEFPISDSTYSFCIYIEGTMTLINLDSIQFYRPPVKADLADKRSSMASVNDVSVVCEKRYAPTVSRSSNEWNERINNNDLIEVLDLIGPSLEDSLDLSYKQAPNLKGTELCAEGNIYRL